MNTSQKWILPDLNPRLNITSDQLKATKEVLETCEARKQAALIEEAQQEQPLSEAPETPSEALQEGRRLSIAAVIGIQAKIESTASKVEKATSIAEKVDLLASIMKWQSALTTFQIQQSGNSK